MKKYIFIFIIVSLFYTQRTFAEVSVTTGIITGQIWYSQEPLVEGQTVKIHTAVWNGDDKPLVARVEFYDKNVILGTRDIEVQAQSLKDVSVSWKVTAGDHSISAKIISSSVISDGKKQNVTLDWIATQEDRTNVSVVIKKQDGTEVKSVDLLKDQVEKAGSKLQDIIPESVTSNANSLDSLRDTTYTQIKDNYTDAKKQIATFSSTQVKSDTKTNIKSQTVSPEVSKNANIIDATQKPLAYLKLFFFSILSFIFGYKIVFYGLLALLVYIILRYFYRKIRNR